jgi:hypothetical protein
MMRYTYDTYAKNDFGSPPRRVDTTTDYDEALLRASDLIRKREYCFTLVTDNLNTERVWNLNSDDSWEGWRTSLERAAAWSDKMKGAVPVEKKFVDDVVDSVFDLHHQHPIHPEADNKCNPRNNSNQHARELYAEDLKKMSKEIAEDIDNKFKETIVGLTPIDPPHYQGYVEDSGISFQWLETMCRIPRYRNNPNEFIAALELQVRKYLDRAGRKDEDLQELQKGLWYYKFMVAYIKNGCNPILVSQVDEILTRKFT